MFNRMCKASNPIQPKNKNLLRMAGEKPSQNALKYSQTMLCHSESLSKDFAMENHRLFHSVVAVESLFDSIWRFLLEAKY